MRRLLRHFVPRNDKNMSSSIAMAFERYASECSLQLSLRGRRLAVFAALPVPRASREGGNLEYIPRRLLQPTKNAGLATTVIARKASYAFRGNLEYIPRRLLKPAKNTGFAVTSVL
jgi:hypothetical protein